MLNADDRVKEEQVTLGAPYTTFRERIVFHSRKRGFPWNGKICKGPKIVAYVNAFRWLAKCDQCDNVEYVTPDDKIFFCHMCGNMSVNGVARPVVFPSKKDRIRIKTLLETRPVILNTGRNDTDAHRNAIPTSGLRRDWESGTTVEQLRKQNEEAGL